MKKVIKSGKSVKVYAVWPEDFRQAYKAFLQRDRKFSDEYFYIKNVSSRAALMELATKYPAVDIELYFSSYADGHMVFSRAELDKAEMFEFLKENQYTVNKIMQMVSE